MSLPLVLLLAGLPPSDPGPRTVTVTGESEVKVTPDEVVISLGLESRSRDLAEVKRLNDQRQREVREAALAIGVPSRDIQTDFFHLEPEFEYSSQRRVFNGYIQRTTLVVTLREVPRFEAFLTAALKAGAEHVHGVTFQTSALRKHRDEARLLAIQAAQEKATALAGALGQRVGKPRSIQEGQGGFWSSYGSWWGRGGMQNLSQNVVSLAGPASASPEGSLSPGTLSIRASVTVTFDLE